MKARKGPDVLVEQKIVESTNSGFGQIVHCGGAEPNAG
jgi:hypothetical protein